MRCDLKTLNECACDPTRCAVQPQTTPAPVVRFSIRTQIITCLFGGVIAGLVIFAVAARAEPHFKTQDQINQEVATNGR